MNRRELLGHCLTWGAFAALQKTEVLNAASLPYWTGMFHNGKEFSNQDLEILEGQLPQGFRGILYRNGPALFDRGTEKVAHHWDGDGAILKVDFSDHTPKASYRFVRTRWFLEEEKKKTLMFPGIKTRIKGPPWANSILNFKNPANTSVLPLKNSLLALSEAGRPYSLNKSDLKTLGELHSFREFQSVIAHPKVCHLTGTGLTIGIRPEDNSESSFRVIEFNTSTGQLIREQKFTSPHRTPLIHDFIVSENYIVLFISPLRMNMSKAMSGLWSLMDCLSWHEALGTEVMVIERHSLREQARFEIPSTYLFHFTGVKEVHNELRFAGTSYETYNAGSNIQYSALLRGELEISKRELPVLKNFTIYLDERRIHEERLLDHWGEFPMVHHDEWTSMKGDFAFCRNVPGLDESFVLTRIARVSLEKGLHSELILPQGMYAHESTLLHDANDPNKSWLLAPVHNGKKGTTEIWVMDWDSLASGPRCRMLLPHPIPLSLHGTWEPLTH